MTAEVLTPQWRKWHVLMGDGLLDLAGNKLDDDPKRVMALIAMAQAHYQAANVRARPSVSDE